jgi:hypothetical protein
MKTSKVFQIEFLTVFWCLLGCSSSVAAWKKVRGHRGGHENDLPDTFRHRSLKKSSYPPTLAPTFVDLAAAQEKEKEAEGEESDLAEGLAEALENNKEDDPTDIPKTVETDSPVVVPLLATKSPTSGPSLETKVPTISPTISTSTPTVTPTAPTVTDIALANEITAAPSTLASNVPPTETAVFTFDNTTIPYNVRLEPFTMTVSLLAGDFDEEGFMEVLAGYMEYYMFQSFPKFQAISYGISTFSKVTALPNTEAQSPITSNITVQIDLLTSTFIGTPTQPDLVITEYMEMLLQNAELFQEYIDIQPDMDVQIHSVLAEFEETVHPTNVQDNTTGNDADAASTGETSSSTAEKKEANIGMIVGITLGCFGALLLIILLLGRRSRPKSK